jgi:hypothetical protein
MNTTDPARGLQVRPGSAGEPHGAKEFELEAVGEILVGEIEELAAFGGAALLTRMSIFPNRSTAKSATVLAGGTYSQVQGDGLRGSACVRESRQRRH